MPDELLLRHQAIILGPHQYGRTVLALREVPSCPIVLVEKYAASQGSRQAALLRQLVTATQRLTKPLCVEYIAAAEDGLGRLYARQISAQFLTKEARYLLYGQNHKEVDMSGAHYELLRRCVGVSQLPPIAQLREAIWTECQSTVQDPNAFAKHLPLRLLNTNAGSTLAFAKEQGYIPGGRAPPSFGRSKILGTTIFLQCCKNIVQAWRSPSVIGAIVRVKLLKATLCSSSTATLVKGYKFPQQSGCTMVCGSIMKSRTMPSGLRKLSLSDMFSQGSRSKNPFLKLSPWQHTLPALRGNLVVLRQARLCGPNYLAGLGIMLPPNMHLFVFSKKGLIQELKRGRISI